MLTSKKQQNVLNGKRLQRDWAAIAEAIGFGEQTLRQMYNYYSGYAHADGLSGAQISVPAQSQIEFIEAHMRTVMIVLSKIIIQYANKFPEAKAMCDMRPDAFHIAEVWSGAANLLL